MRPAWKYETITCDGYLGRMKPRSRSATGSSFLFLMAEMAWGSRRSPQSGDAAVSSCTAMPSVNHRGTRCFVAESTYTWLSSCHMVLAQWKLPGLRPDGLSIATTYP